MNEVDREGNVVHLTSLDAPQEVIRFYGFVSFYTFEYIIMIMV